MAKTGRKTGKRGTRAGRGARPSPNLDSRRGGCSRVGACAWRKRCEPAPWCWIPIAARRLKYSSATIVRAPSRLYASWCLLLLTSKRSCRLSHDVASSAHTTVSFAMRARLNEAAWLFKLKTAGTEFSPHSRTATTTLSLLPWFRRFNGDHGDVLWHWRASRGCRLSLFNLLRQRRGCAGRVRNRGVLLRSFVPDAMQREAVQRRAGIHGSPCACAASFRAAARPGYDS